jgi:hypothetical protein
MDFGHERTRGIEYLELRRLGFAPHGMGNPVSTEDQNAAGWNFIEVFDKYCSLFFQILHHETVVHHFMPHVDRGTVCTQRTLDNFDCTVHSCAETAGVCKQYLDHFAVLH